MVRDYPIPTLVAVHVLLPGARDCTCLATARDVHLARGMLVPKEARGHHWHGVLPVRHISELAAKLRIDEVGERGIATAWEAKDDCSDRDGRVEVLPEHEGIHCRDRRTETMPCDEDFVCSRALETSFHGE